MNFLSCTSIIFSIFLSTTICAPTENSTTESIPTSTKCLPKFCPEVLCDTGTKRIVPPCGCPTCIREDNSNLTTISLANNSNNEVTPTKGSTTIGFPPHSCRVECKVTTCKEGEKLARDPNLLCSCPRCEPVTTESTSTEETHLPDCDFICPAVTCRDGEVWEDGDPNVRCSCPRCVPVSTEKSTTSVSDQSTPQGSTTNKASTTECILHCPLISCPAGQEPEQTPGRCQCPKICVPILVNLRCDIFCEPITCPPGETLYRNPSSSCGCPYCVPNPSNINNASTTECILNCPLISCPPGEEPEKTPGLCQCPKKCVRISNFRCDIACPPKTCPPGEILYRNPSTSCGCPYCVPSTSNPTTTNVKVSLPPLHCNIACLIPTCLPGYILYRDPNSICSCPKCVFDTSTRRPIHCKLMCPVVTCLDGEKLYRNPTEICACPKCIPDPTVTPIPIRTSRLSYECKITCPDLICPLGQRLEKDPRDVCSCPSCTLDTPYTPEAHCDLICLPPVCGEGEVVVRDARECSCPRCECLRPRICPAIACLGTWKYPPCGCPICLPSYEIDVY